MADVKVPAKLHLMSKAAQKAWYKKNNMEMPKEKSVAQSGKIKPAEKKAVAPVKPKSAREISMERQKAYYAKGGRAPIGAGGSGGSSAMAGVGQSSAKEIIKGIKAGINPKVALVRYTQEQKVFETNGEYNRYGHPKAGSVDIDPTSSDKPPVYKKRPVARYKPKVEEATKQEAEKLLGGPVKEKPKMPAGKQPAEYRYVRNLARKAMKAGMKKEEVESVEEGVATAQKVMDRANVVAKTNPDPKKRFAASGLANKAMLRTINPTGVNTGITRGGGNKTYRKITGKAPPYQLTPKTGISEEMQYIEEKLTAADPASKWISDFVASDNPKFAGKSKKERINMALGAYYAAKRGTNEEVVAETAGKITHIVAKDKLEDHKDAMDSEGYDTHTKPLPKNHPKAKTHIGIVAQSPVESDYHENMGHAEPIHEEVEQIDEAFDKSSPAHAKAQELVSNYGNRSAMRAVYHGDGTATIHTTGDKKVSSTTRVDHIHDQAGLGYNRSAAEYKDSSRSKGGLKFKTKETEGKSIYGSHEIHISHKGMKEEIEQVEEKYMGFKAVMASAKKGGARDPAAVAAAIGRKKYGKEKFQAAAAAGKKMGEEVEQTDEAVRIVDIEKKGKLPKKQDVRDRLALAARERRKITGGSGVKGFNKPIGFSPTKYMDTSYIRAIKKEEVFKNVAESMDPVGREDKDIDNDGDTDKTDVYLHNKRKAIGNAIRKKLASKLEKKDGE